jgi:hypothetical protein
MHWRVCARSMAVGVICLMATLVAGASVAPAQAQAMSVFNPYDPQWAAVSSPYSFLGFDAGSNLTPGTSQQVFSTKVSSGTVGLFVESGAVSGNLFGSQFMSPTFGPYGFSGLADSTWKSSIVGSYKSNLGIASVDGLYTTARLGITSFSTTPVGPPGLTSLFGNTNATGVTASAGVGLQLTPQITIEGSVGFTQGPVSPFR